MLSAAASSSLRRPKVCSLEVGPNPNPAANPKPNPSPDPGPNPCPCPDPTCRTMNIASGGSGTWFGFGFGFGLGFGLGPGENRRHALPRRSRATPSPRDIMGVINAEEAFDAHERGPVRAREWQGIAERRERVTKGRPRHQPKPVGRVGWTRRREHEREARARLVRARVGVRVRVRVATP